MLLASKAGTEVSLVRITRVNVIDLLDSQYAVKHTPLHPHHPLIATRLLREPTILAQLLPHPNLVKVSVTSPRGAVFMLTLSPIRSTRRSARLDISISSRRTFNRPSL